MEPSKGETTTEQAVIEPLQTESLFPETQLPLAELCEHVHSRVAKFLADESRDENIRSAQKQTRISLQVIQCALERYSPSEISLSYNGGKDCLVLLILYLCALHTYASSNATPVPPIQSVYIVSPHPFPEVELFVASSSQICSLSLSRYAKAMKPAFADYLHDFPAVKAIFVGTRRTDPHGQHLTHFDPTDRGWPSFMRIHPVIDWCLKDIWTFIRYLHVPYISLYDQGYTSLGGTTDTHRNPALRRRSVSDTVAFRPAYEMLEDDEERLGRDWEERNLKSPLQATTPEPK